MITIVVIEKQLVFALKVFYNNCMIVSVKMYKLALIDVQRLCIQIETNLKSSYFVNTGSLEIANNLSKHKTHDRELIHDLIEQLFNILTAKRYYTAVPFFHSTTDSKKVVVTAINSIKKYLPIPCITSKIPLIEFIKQLNNANENLYAHRKCLDVYTFLKNIDKSKFTLKKIKQFAKRNGLTKMHHKLSTDPQIYKLFM